MPDRLMVDTDEAASLILREVARNRAIIVFPFYSRFFWWVNRLHPALYAPLNRVTMMDFRRSIRHK